MTHPSVQGAQGGREQPVPVPGQPQHRAGRQQRQRAGLRQRLAQDATFGQRCQDPRPVSAGAAGFQHRREPQPCRPLSGPGRWSAGAEGEGSRLSSSSRGGKRLRRGALLSHSERCAGAPRGSANRSPGPERGPAAAALPGSSRGSGTGPAGTSREPTRRGGGGPGRAGGSGCLPPGYNPPAHQPEGTSRGGAGAATPGAPQGQFPYTRYGGGAGAAPALPKMEGPCPGFVPPGKPPWPRQRVPPPSPPRLLHRLPGPPPRSAPPHSADPAAASPPALRAASRTPRQTPHPRAASRNPRPHPAP